MGFGELPISTYRMPIVKVHSVKKRYTDSPADSRRNYSRVFYVQNGSVSSKICEQAFLKIHAISNGRLNRALNAVEKSGGSPHQDQRGKHEPVNKTPTDRIGLVKEHITSFPATSSHYSRADNLNWKYLSSQLSLSKMYFLYKEMCSSKSQQPVSEWVYCKIFNGEFNLSFGRYVLSLPPPHTHKNTLHASHTHTHTHASPFLSLSLSLSHTHSSWLSLSHNHTHSLTHSLTHTRFSPKTDTCKTCDNFKVKVDA